MIHWDGRHLPAGSRWQLVSLAGLLVAVIVPMVIVLLLVEAAW